MSTRRQWLRAAVFSMASPSVWAAQKGFWQTKDPAAWNNTDKQFILNRSPWAREGLLRIEENKKQPTEGYASQGGQPAQSKSGGMPEAAQSVPIGQPMPPVPRADGEPVQFRVLARWETAKPVRLAGGPQLPELTGQFYVIRLRGLPLMPPLKPKPGEEAPPDPNQGMLQAIKDGTRLEREDKAPIPCAHLLTGSGNEATEVLLFFPRTPDPITAREKTVTLDSRFAAFHLSIRFPLKEMLYRGELTL